MVNKEWYKKILLHSQRTRPETKIHDIFANFRNNQGLCLTKLGLHVICSMDIEREEFKLPQEYVCYWIDTCNILIILIKIGLCFSVLKIEYSTKCTAKNGIILYNIWKKIYDTSRNNNGQSK